MNAPHRTLPALVLLGLFFAGCVDKAPDSDGVTYRGTSSRAVLEDPFDIGHWRAWNQLGGDPGHSGSAILPRGPLDVFAVGRLEIAGIQSPKSFSSFDVLPTPHGLIRFVEDNEELVCNVGLFPELRSGHPARNATVPCFGSLDGTERTIMIGHDQARGLFVLCSPGGTTADSPPGSSPYPTIHAWSPADLSRPIWSVDGRALRGDNARDAAGQVYCRGGAALSSDAGKLYVALEPTAVQDGGPAMVLVLDIASGGILSRFPIPTFGAVDASNPSAPSSANVRFTPLSLTLTKTGIVLLGWGNDYNSDAQNIAAGNLIDPQNPYLDRNFVVWMNLEGNVLGYASLEGSPPRPQSAFATSRDDTAVFAMGDFLYFLNPGTSANPVRVPMARPQSGTELRTYWAAPAWWQDYVIVPTDHAVTAYSPRNVESKWSWEPLDAWQVSGVVIDVGESVYVVAYRESVSATPGAVGSEAALFQLRLSDGVEVRQIPLPLDPHPRGAVANGGAPLPMTANLLAIENVGLLASDWHGNYALLARSGINAGGKATPADPYPSTSDYAILKVDASGSLLGSAIISWGDGQSERIAGGQQLDVAHNYIAAGTYEGHVTFVADDARTQSVPFTFRVGETPPPRLNVMQKAFSSDNQEFTFFLLGLALTSAGAGYAVVRRTRRHGRLGIYLEQLRSIRRTGRDDPTHGLPDLVVFRRTLRHHWQEGRLDEGGYMAVESRAQAATRLMTSLFIEDLGGTPGNELTTLFYAALDDGELSTREISRLEKAVKTDRGITAADRSKLRDLFDLVVRA